MSLRTYAFKLSDKYIVRVKATKEQAEQVGERFRQLADVRRYCREISGVVGRQERSVVYMSLFGPGHALADEAAYEKDVADLFHRLPDVLTESNWRPFVDEAAELFKKHVPVKDARTTPAEEAVRQAEIAAREAQRQAEIDQWRAQWCQEKPVAIPKGMMACYLEMTFDNSDTQTDYFDTHHQVGDDMLLGLVPKGAEREALARKVLARYPELAELEWEWHTENYSMGHGNYLMSEWTDHEEDLQGSDGRRPVTTRWEIRFTDYGSEIQAYRNYPGQPEISPAPAPAGGPATVRRNEAHNGIEVVFPAKPEPRIIDGLKGLGFRWSKFQALWYARYSEALWEQVHSLLKETAQSQS